MNVSALDAMVDLLRQQRIKAGTDYAIQTKYGEVRILCNEVFFPAIKDAACVHNVKVVNWYLFTN